MQQTLEMSFGEVRSLLQGEPSGAAVERLIARVVEAEATDRAAVEATWMSYIHAHLERWHARCAWAPRWSLNDWGWSADDTLWAKNAVARRLLHTRSALLGAVRGVSLYPDKDNPDDGPALRDALRSGALGRLEWLEWLTATQTGEADEVLDALLAHARPGLRALGWTERAAGSRLSPKLLESPLLGQLEALTLHGELDLSGMRQLTRHLDADRLRHLELSTRPDDAMIRQLIWHPASQNLRSLGLCYTWFGAECLEVLERAPALPQLEALTFASCDLLNDHITALLGWEGMGRVRGLMAALNDVRGEGLRALALHPRAQALRELELGGNAQAGEALEERAVVEALGRRMEALVLWSCGLSDAALAECGRGEWPALRRLDLGHAGARDEALWPLCEGLARMPALESLILSQNHLSDDGLRLIVTHMPATLRSLELQGTQITDAGALILSSSSSMTHIKKLNIANTKIGEYGVDILKKSPHTRHLFEEEA